jgi:hypothetical protein
MILKPWLARVKRRFIHYIPAKLDTASRWKEKTLKNKKEVGKALGRVPSGLFVVTAKHNRSS